MQKANQPTVNVNLPMSGSPVRVNKLQKLLSGNKTTLDLAALIKFSCESGIASVDEFRDDIREFLDLK